MGGGRDEKLCEKTKKLADRSYHTNKPISLTSDNIDRSIDVDMVTTAPPPKSGQSARRLSTEVIIPNKLCVCELCSAWRLWRTTPTACHSKNMD
jgi:hypothetical protein